MDQANAFSRCITSNHKLVKETQDENEFLKKENDDLREQYGLMENRSNLEIHYLKQKLKRTKIQRNAYRQTAFKYKNNKYLKRERDWEEGKIVEHWSKKKK